MFIVFLLLIQLCYVVNAHNCLPEEECTVKSWREWENCSGNCKNITKQVRKRTICVDFEKVQPFTRENVVQFCNITVPTVETRPCQTCPVGIYNVISQKCEKCNYVNCRDDPCQQGTCNDTAYGIRCSCYPGYAGFDCGMMIPRDKTMTQYLLPLWMPPLEYGILTLTTLIIIMAAGCLCLKCCRLCGACSSDDDDDDDEERKRKKNKPFPYRSHGFRNTRKPSVVIDF
uniref:Uncharacterized protein LOC111133825 isoform X1 n=1 Tax=Crassostrea virginica TaxID=6565 RepID=A0A8B8EDN8_CRAVI|nr:uncharacterized protein LOC111133825 isoform X1 [Crassostrea virginica]